MLVKFRSRDTAEIVMFGDIALELIRLMGHGGTVPGAIAAEDVPAALDKLEAGLARHAQAHPADTAGGEDEEGQPRVGIGQRAFPLVDMLKRAVRKKSYVMWDK